MHYGLLVTLLYAMSIYTQLTNLPKAPKLPLIYLLNVESSSCLKSHFQHFMIVEAPQQEGLKYVL